MFCLRFLGGGVLGDHVVLAFRCFMSVFLCSVVRLLWCVQKAIHVLCAMTDVSKVP